jgi:demethylmenaquinone methyltransferase / 2-methoxy-6-polyprenyl-1,4-benzoquinol methylase
LATPAETARSDRKRHALELFAGLPRAYDRMGAAISFGQDPRWRRALVSAIAPHPGLSVLDVATGTGMVAFALARKGATVTGLDQSQDMLGGARRQAAQHPELAGRLTFVQGEAERLPFPDQAFDALSFTYLLRYVDDPAATMRELARVLKPGGRIGMVEFGVPESPPLKALWRVYTRIGLPAVGRLVSPAWQDVGRFLGPDIEQFHAREPDLAALWRQAGLDDVQTRAMSFGAGIVMSGVRSRDGQRAA